MPIFVAQTGYREYFSEHAIKLRSQHPAAGAVYSSGVGLSRVFASRTIKQCDFPVIYLRSLLPGSSNTRFEL
jgi:hypothetical protein